MNELFINSQILRRCYSIYKKIYSRIYIYINKLQDKTWILHQIACQIVSKGFFHKHYSNINSLPTADIFEFEKFNYLVRPSFLDADSINFIKNEFQDKIASSDNEESWTQPLEKPIFNRVLYSYPAEYLNQIRSLKRPTDKIPNLIDLIYSKFSLALSQIHRSNFRIDNLWIYETINNGELTYNYNSQWHLDGDPDTSIKVLVYLVDVNLLNGPLVIKDPETKLDKPITAPAGTAIFFRSGKILHSASNTTKAPRMTLSFLTLPCIYRNRYKEKQINILKKKTPLLW